jgi:hypothetical protein
MSTTVFVLPGMVPFVSNRVLALGPLIESRSNLRLAESSDAAHLEFAGFRKS